MFVRVRDKETRHEFDLPEGHLYFTQGLVELVNKEAYPPSPVPRPARHFVKQIKSSTPAKNGGGFPIGEENAK